MQESLHSGIFLSVRDLRLIKLFSKLPDTALEKIQQNAAIRIHLAGASILCEGDAQVPVSFVLEGRVRIYRTNPGGREQTLAYLDQGEVFNLPTAFSATGNSPASVMAELDTQLLDIPQEKFRELAGCIPELALAVMIDLSEKLERLAELVHDVSLRSVRNRLARFLLIQKRTPSQLNWTQEQIAMQIGSTREGVSRALKELSRMGLIRTQRQRILIVDELALSQLSD